MKKYIKPEIEDEIINIEDICLESSESTNNGQNLDFDDWMNN